MLTDNTKQIGIRIAVLIFLIVLGSSIVLMPWTESGITVNESGSQMIERTIPNINLNIQTPLEVIKINAKRPEPRTSFPYYRAYFANGDVADKFFGDTEKERHNLTTIEKAPDIARKAMVPYGGIPSDAYVSISRTNGGTIGPGTPEEKKLQTNNQVYFSRTINGIPITGMDDGIIVWLGDNGELLRYKKFWRTLEKVGDVPVVSVDKAIQKLEKREMVNPLQNPSDATINTINIRYYAKSWNEKEIYLEPVYEFYAKLPNDHDYQFFVYARQFAAFDQTPAMTRKSVAGKSVEEKDPFTATFTDTSDANPTKWQWDFGDGTTSAEQNPTHTYKAAGTYNVTLMVWNDMGSDTLTQQYIVDDVPAKTADADSTAETTDTVAAGDETPAIDTPTPVETVVETTGNVDNPTNSSIVTETASAIPTILLETTQNTTAINST